MNKDILIDFYIQPGAKKNGISGYFGEKIKIKIKSPAIENKANNELILFLAEKLNIPKKNIEIVYGKNSRIKTLKINNSLSKEEIINNIFK